MDLENEKIAAGCAAENKDGTSVGSVCAALPV
jgi:hypothetical protein